jgi:hypothetical protein
MHKVVGGVDSFRRSHAQPGDGPLRICLTVGSTISNLPRPVDPAWAVTNT